MSKVPNFKCMTFQAMTCAIFKQFKLLLLNRSPGFSEPAEIVLGGDGPESGVVPGQRLAGRHRLLRERWVRGRSVGREGHRVCGRQRDGAGVSRDGNLRALQLRLQRRLLPRRHGDVQKSGQSIHSQGTIPCNLPYSIHVVRLCWGGGSYGSYKLY